MTTLVAVVAVELAAFNHGSLGEASSPRTDSGVIAGSLNGLMLGAISFEDSGFAMSDEPIFIAHSSLWLVPSSA
jgi:hypothetical protein